jgi:ACS family tartrate transporter-like MFS transporter
MVLIALVTMGTAYLPALWAMPTEILNKSAAAAAVGMIDAVGSIAGFSGPYLFGYINTKSGSFTYGLAMLAATTIAGGLLVLAAKESKSLFGRRPAGVSSSHRRIRIG